ncbi:BZ3500_MvSof-1268-A1-R1_Chr12-1g03636 [Microbotryum saponariae]|uniref:BZ3500_MvSof-1268-A1-R1_Chr12-1g03636 protein n=1 Tax=Microbotryum saponariae TaxID=289078 RepID=A0A2X0LHG8_9BASI|nr:BZ3500_MvSof-1268-A1-R1_Chr12-1g03636 [Microbotryum saponariae]SDA05229.1 BZ3501_MvSof-1269-A2-R1_Chr12-1g03213 [Microbotryum saponariae]
MPTMPRIPTRTIRALVATPSHTSTPLVRAYATTAAHSTCSSSSTSIPTFSSHTQPPPTHARTRPLPARKQLLYASHANLLTSNELVLFLRQTDFTAHEYNTFRTQLAALTGTGTEPDLTYTLTVLRPGLLSALLRDPTLVQAIEAIFLAEDSHTKGALSVLTAKTFDPPTFKKVLKLVNTYSALPSANQPPTEAAAKGGVAEPTPERLRILSALAESKAIEQERVKGLGELPKLHTLRAQLVGLLSSPAGRIVGVLGARADEVKRTLQGFQLALQEKHEPGKKE